MHSSIDHFSKFNFPMKFQVTKASEGLFTDRRNLSQENEVNLRYNTAGLWWKATSIKCLETFKNYFLEYKSWKSVKTSTFRLNSAGLETLWCDFWVGLDDQLLCKVQTGLSLEQCQNVSSSFARCSAGHVSVAWTKFLQHAIFGHLKATPELGKSRY